MTIDSANDSVFPAIVDCIYADLIPSSRNRAPLEAEQSRDRRLLYAGELDSAGGTLVTAANIAGISSLSATTNKTEQNQAIRDSVIHFLVTRFNEAMQILKNRENQHEAVAVCVAASPEEIESEMQSSGVVPDLLPPGVLDAPRYQPFLDQGARQVNPLPARKDQTVITWTVDSAPTLWLPRLDSIACDCLASSQDSDTSPVFRWLRLAPHYLGRLAQEVRLLRCRTETAHELLRELRKQVASARIDVGVKVSLATRGKFETHRLSPPKAT